MLLSASKSFEPELDKCGVMILMNQMDLLENDVMNDVVVLSVVLEEVKNKNMSIHSRLRAVTDNPLRHFFVFSNENHKYDTLYHRYYAPIPCSYS